MTILTIPKRMTHGDELIVVGRKEYEQLRREFTELKDAFGKIRQGEMELKLGKTRVIASLSEL